MKNMRAALWLMISSQALFLLTSLMEPPSSLVMIILRLVVPLILIGFFGLMLAGYISPRKR